jgi:hypothetical protein
MSDRAQRSIRTLFQSVLAIIAAGGFVSIWNVVTENHQIDPVIAAVVTIVLGPALVSWAQNELEDAGKIKTVLKEPATPAAEKKTYGLTGGPP